MESNQIQEGQKISPQLFKWHTQQAYTFSLLCALVLGAVAMPFSVDIMGLAYSPPTIVLLIVALVSIFFDAEVWHSRMRLGYAFLRFLALTAFTIATFGVLILFLHIGTYVLSHYTVLIFNDMFSTLFGISGIVIYVFLTVFITGVIVSFTLAVSSRRMRARAKFFTSIGLSVGLGGLFLHVAIQVVLKNIGVFDIFNATDGMIVFNYFASFLIGWIAAILGAHFGGFLRLGELSLSRLHNTMSRPL